MGEVNADLMRAPRVKPQAQETVVAVRSLRFVMGTCGLSVLCHAAEDDARQGTRDRCINTARRGHDRAFDQGEVLAPQRVLAHDLVLHLGVLCDEEQPARIAVEAVAGVNVEMDAAGGIVSAHGVRDGAARFLCRRMDELSCGFVEDEQIVVLIDNRKRQRFGNDGADDRQIVCDVVAVLHHRACSDRRAAVPCERTMVFDAFPQAARDAVHTHEVGLGGTCFSSGEIDAELCHFCAVASLRRRARMMRKEMERMMAITVASDIPRRVTVPMVMLAVDTPTPMTMEVRRRFIGLL